MNTKLKRNILKVVYNSSLYWPLARSILFSDFILLFSRNRVLYYRFDRYYYITYCCTTKYLLADLILNYISSFHFDIINIKQCNEQFVLF